MRYTSNTWKGFSAISIAWIVGLVGFTSLATGCTSAPKTTQLHLTTYNEAGQPSSFHTDFGKASFTRESDNRIELAFRNEAPSSIDPTQTITQIVFIDMFWAPVYGRMRLNSTQVNVRVQYAILTPPTGIRYDGGGFVTYKVDPWTNEIYGWFETGDLAPSRTMGNAIEPFGPTRIFGSFRARNDGGTVVNLRQQLESQFTTPLATRQ